MPTSLDRTYETLAKSRNDAAAAVLLTALEHGDVRVFDRTVLALVGRRNKAGHTAVLRRWPTLSQELKQAIDESQGRMGGALHEALLSADDDLFASACDVARESGEFDLAPTLITVAEGTEGPRGDAAIELIVAIVDRLVYAAPDENAEGFSRHPETIRRSVLESLERSVERFVVHGRRSLIEAFVVLAGPESSLLRNILESTQHKCHQTVVDTLSISTNPDVLELLTACLLQHEAPLAVRNVIARRTDAPFVACLLRLPLDASNIALSKNLARIKSFACLASPDSVCKQMPPEAQAAAMRLVALSGATEESKLDFAAALLARGSQAARLAACAALEPIAGRRSNELVLASLDDPDGDVQAAATRQLRDRHIPGTMAKFIELVGSPHPQVQAAARESLEEFSFEYFIARYETLDNEARRTTGELVALVDVNVVPGLKQEMASLVRRRRLRAIEIAELMKLTAKVADALVERLDDEDHMIRAAAASALAECSSFDVRDALLGALGDRSHVVQTAARESLRTMGFGVGASAGFDPRIFNDGMESL